MRTSLKSKTRFHGFSQAGGKGHLYPECGMRTSFKSKTRFHGFSQAGGKGFEPLLTDPESAVLPLDEPPTTFSILPPPLDDVQMDILYILAIVVKLRVWLAVSAATFPLLTVPTVLFEGNPEERRNHHAQIRGCANFSP